MFIGPALLYLCFAAVALVLAMRKAWAAAAIIGAILVAALVPPALAAVAWERDDMAHEPLSRLGVTVYAAHVSFLVTDVLALLVSLVLATRYYGRNA